ncbi:MAG: enolase C-terminal domain-like protein [Thermoplasmata archaeon]
MTLIEDLVIRKVLDSRGNPTVEVDVHTTNGFGRFSAPSGASTGAHEAQAFPEGNVDLALERFDSHLVPKVLGLDAVFQGEVDDALRETDGTADFSFLGANAAVATSLAAAKAASDALSLPLYRYLGGMTANRLPRPFGNLLGGGAHAPGGTVIQEFLSVAMGPTVADSVQANAQAHRNVGEALRAKFPKAAIGRGDEGAWTAAIEDEEALGIVGDVCAQVQDELGFPCRPALDMAASEFYEKGKYRYRDQTLDPAEQIDYVTKLVEDYDLYAVEDPLEQDDFGGFGELTARVGDRCLIIGDDLFVTNVDRIRAGVEAGAANGVLVKPNQVGTLTDAWMSVDYAHGQGLRTVLSHRSGETPDATIAHLAVAFRCEGIKTGAVGGERIAKLNELIRIEEELT